MDFWCLIVVYSGYTSIQYYKFSSFYVLGSFANISYMQKYMHISVEITYSLGQSVILDQYALPNSTPLFFKNSVIVPPLYQYAPMGNNFCLIDEIEFKFNKTIALSLQKGSHQSYLKVILLAGVTFLGKTCLELTQKMFVDFLLISHQPISAPSRLVSPLDQYIP